MKKDEYPVAIEMPSELWANDELITTFLCSPYDLKDLGVGHLLTRGIITDISQIKNITVDEKSYKIIVHTKELISEERFSVPKFILSGVSSIDKFNDNIYNISKVDDIEVSLEYIVKTAKTMIDEAVLYETTGGVHTAIINNLENDYFLREDVGRHCAVDKSIGAYALKDLNFKESFVCTTGRISLDMLLKSAALGIPIIASLKRPSSLAVDLANHYGICIVARVLSNKPLIYTNEEKIIL